MHNQTPPSNDSEFPCYGSTLRLCEKHAQSIAGLNGQKIYADNDAASPTGLVGLEESTTCMAVSFPCKHLYPTPWKIDVLTHGLGNGDAIAETMVADAALRNLCCPAGREYCCPLEELDVTHCMGDPCRERVSDGLHQVLW